jgi:hypothetical protein
MSEARSRAADGLNDRRVTLVRVEHVDHLRQHSEVGLEGGHLCPESGERAILSAEALLDLTPMSNDQLDLVSGGTLEIRRQARDRVARGQRQYTVL